VECCEQGQEGHNGCDFVEEEECSYMADGSVGEGNCVAVEKLGD
jgi:hypothetical protein